MSEYLDLLRRNRDFRLLWLGNIVSLVGDWFNLIASAQLIAQLTSSGIAISYLFLARFIPAFLFSPIAGTLADRFDRRRLLIASDLLRAVTVLGFLLVRSADQLWLFYGLTIVQFALSALFTPARSAMIANLVPRIQLVTANALDSLTWSTMLAFGALLGGIVAGMFGVVTAFVADAATFVLSAYVIGLIAFRPIPRPNSPDSAASTTFRDGLRYLRGHRFILFIALVKGGGSLVWGAMNVLEVNFAEAVFPIGVGGATTLGIIYAVTGIGTGVGPIAMRRWLGDARHRLVLGITIGFAFLTAGLLIISQSNSLTLFLAGTLVRTVGTGTIWVFSAVLLQAMVPDEYRGRVFAFEFALLTLTQSVSILWAGVAQDNLQLSPYTIVLSMGLLAAVVSAVWSTLARKRMQPSVVQEPA